MTKIDRQANSTTAAAKRLFTYDSNGYTASATGWNGNLTTLPMMVMASRRASPIQNLRLPGQYADAESGCDYSYFRNYVPLSGRYLGSDLLGLPAARNTYGYANGNPADKIDRFGLWQAVMTIGIGPALTVTLGRIAGRASRHRR